MKLESVEQELKEVPMVETVEELHGLLRSKHCDFSRNDKDFYYVIEFVDKSTDSILFCSCYESPIFSLRELPNVLEKTKSSVENVLVQLRFAVPRPTDMFECVVFNDTFLSPYLYFKRPEPSADNSGETVKALEADK